MYRYSCDNVMYIMNICIKPNHLSYTFDVVGFFEIKSFELKTTTPFLNLIKNKKEFTNFSPPILYSSWSRHTIEFFFFFNSEQNDVVIKLTTICTIFFPTHDKYTIRNISIFRRIRCFPKEYLCFSDE